MKSIALVLALILALAGCAQFDKQFGQQAALSTGIAPGEVEWARKTGRNTVSGNASLKSGGTTHTCAGQSANLIPDTAYARARMTAIFGNAKPRHARRQPGPGEVRARRSALRLDPAHGALRCLGQLLLPRRARRRLVRHDQREMAGTSQVEGSSMMQRVDVQGGRLVKVMLP